MRAAGREDSVHEHDVRQTAASHTPDGGSSHLQHSTSTLACSRPWRSILYEAVVGRALAASVPYSPSTKRRCSGGEMQRGVTASCYVTLGS